MVQLDARVFDSTTGRFVARDPLGEQATFNLYSYPGQNPYHWIDPSGLSPEDSNGSKSGLSDDGLAIVSAGDFKELMNKFIDHLQGSVTSEGLEMIGLGEIADGSHGFESLSRDSQEVLATLLGDTNAYLLSSYDLSGSAQIKLTNGMEWSAAFLNGDMASAFSAMDGIQIGLDVLAMSEAPIVSQLAGFASAGIDFSRGDWKMGALGLFGTLPGLGLAADSTRLARRGYGVGRSMSGTVDDGASLGRNLAAGGPRAEPNRIYSARELLRRAEEPGPYHNFPEAFNQAIFRGNRTVISDNYVMYTTPGFINGTRGTFEIGVVPSASGRTEVIYHRFFRPGA